MRTQSPFNPYMHQPPSFRRIGAGFCGSVWAQEGRSLALKREDGGPGRSLWNDYDMHRRLLRAVIDYSSTTAIPLNLSVPACHRFITADDTQWWSENLPRFPPGYSPSNVLQSERIPQLPEMVREFLIDQYCPTSLTSQIKTSEANQDCLVRPYLGRRRQPPAAASSRPSRFRAFSLRNLPLHLDQMEELNLDTTKYSKTMADALALMHWSAEMDANDVEFVLARPRQNTTSSTGISETPSSGVLGDHTMWVLDFDCCRPMSMDEAGIDQAVSAFFRNDPFYPRPGPRGDQALWEAFRHRYLETSSTITIGCSERTQLPLRFIQKVEAAGI